jgi:MoaA/NifB/PqqE/SkfB family radical SAM enzyme
VTISILGTEPIHDSITGIAGSFRKAARAIEDLIQLLPTDRVSVNFVLLPENASVVADVTKLVEELGATRLVIQLFDPALNRCGIVAGVDEIPPPDYLDWSSVDLASVGQMLEEVQHRASSELAVLLASSMTPAEIIDYVSGVFDVTRWTCAEVFDTMRCSPTGKVYTCNGLEIGTLDLHTVLELWQSGRFTAFRQAHLNAILEPGCKGCCKVRRRS